MQKQTKTMSLLEEAFYKSFTFGFFMIIIIMFFSMLALRLPFKKWGLQSPIAWKDDYDRNTTLVKGSMIAIGTLLLYTMANYWQLSRDTQKV